LLTKCLGEVKDEQISITAGTLYDQIVPPGTKTKTADYKAFTFKAPEVFDD